MPADLNDRRIHMGYQTKIFSLGLGRTGTTSLHAALVLMNISSIHFHSRAAQYWLSGNFAADVMKEFDACLDIPTPVYYPQLDQRYPRSKFILLEREVDAWVDSIERQWGAAPPSSRKSVFRDMVRVATYGIFRFNAERLRDVYLRHTHNVKRYFSDRSEDLLVLNLADADSDCWGELSGFLGIDKPKGFDEFPHLRSPHIGEIQSVKKQEVETKKKLMADLVLNDDKQADDIPPPVSH